MKKLTLKQQQVYDFILQFTNEHGFSPSVREICMGVNLRSPSSVHAHLKTLETLGYLNKIANKTRTLSVGDTKVAMVPILGTVAAGTPILAVENVDAYIPFDKGNKSGDFFALRVRGDSMINAGILEGDIVIIRSAQTAEHNDIVVALIEDEATVKRLKKDKNGIILMPENERYEPIIAENPLILGTVISLIRQYR